MGSIRHVVRWTVRLLLGVLLLLLLYLAAALLLSVLPARSVAWECPERSPAYVHTNGVHLFLVLPTATFDTAFVAGLRLPEDPPYLGFGWGEKEFYRSTPTWADLRPGTALRAAFWPSASAMHVITYRYPRRHWKQLDLCPQQRDTLVQFVQRSFLPDSTGAFTPVQAVGYDANDFFYEARGHYTAFRTCNVWVNEALKRAGIRTSVWSPFDKGVLYHLPE